MERGIGARIKQILAKKERHGWGGDFKKRAISVQNEFDDLMECVEHPEKCNPPTDADLDLLHEMFDK